ncbi:formyltetrahydrofolate deformylase, partial [Tetzosporium hominis]
MNAYMKQQLSQYQEINNDKARLLVSCPDQPGIVAAVSSFLFENGANIIESNQYTTDPEGGRFFLRIEFEVQGI